MASPVGNVDEMFRVESNIKTNQTRIFCTRKNQSLRQNEIIAKQFSKVETKTEEFITYGGCSPNSDSRKTASHVELVHVTRRIKTNNMHGTNHPIKRTTQSNMARICQFRIS
ncbi:hypothetical protein LSAT2_020417 [Lamellibrachia satsuma]|nr:hypothetical protein LSAT2_020417 [Lamellibrachia satsuma]